MNKQQILDKLNSENINGNEVIIISGASLVLQGIIDSTSDIDMACTESYYKALPWKTEIGGCGKEIKRKDVFDISNNLYYPDCIEYVEGYRVMNVEKCYEIKKMLNRDKDKQVIKLLENYLKENGWWVTLHTKK